MFRLPADRENCSRRGSLALYLETVFPFSAVNLSAIPWDFILILIVLGVLVPWRGAVRVRRLLAQPALTSSQRLFLYASTITFQWFIVAVVYWRSAPRHLTPTHPWVVLFRVLRAPFLALLFSCPLFLDFLAV